MSQNDMIVEAGTGAEVRSRINDALAALASTSKGPSAPSTAYAGQLWWDDNTPASDNWTLNAYTGAAWRAVGTLDTTNGYFVPNGIHLAGSASAPGFTPAGDADTGIWAPGSNTFAISTSGTERLRITPSGLFGLGVTPSALVHISNARDDTQVARIRLENTNAAGGFCELLLQDNRGSTDDRRFSIRNVQGSGYFGRLSDDTLTFTEWARWVAGTFMLGATAADGSTNGIVLTPGADAVVRITNGSGSRSPLAFYRNGSASPVGSVSTTDSATSYNTSSDERLKRDYEEIGADQAEAAVRGLRPLLGRFNVEAPDAPKRPMYLAHEYQAVVPHAVVGERGGAQMMAAQYDPMSPYFAAALVSALDRIAALEARIAVLEG